MPDYADGIEPAVTNVMRPGGELHIIGDSTLWRLCRARHKRHGFATDLLRRSGGDLALVQAALCHRSITSTLVYARVDAGRVRAALG